MIFRALSRVLSDRIKGKFIYVKSLKGFVIKSRISKLQKNSKLREISWKYRKDFRKILTVSFSPNSKFKIKILLKFYIKI
jgi:hypothetical protein